MRDEDINSFYGGEQIDAYKHFGCHLDGDKATFAVFAPRAASVSVIGDFNDWSELPLTLKRGIWMGEVKGAKVFDKYKYLIKTYDGRTLYKADPYGVHVETGGNFCSKIYDLSVVKWTDDAYMKARESSVSFKQPISIYEAHIGSWRRYEDGNYFDYRKFADEAAPYIKEMGYTHVELMGIAEYPFDGSWGYQVTGYYAPTSRYGTPADFAYLVNKFHKEGIGVILDWVPGHFPKDSQGLYEFDGQPLYEPEDPLRREHEEWGTRCFDYGRKEVTSFLISNAMYWLKEYHVDGLRVDAVASMLYLDYARKQWRPNQYGGKENIDAINFFRKLNTKVYAEFKNVMMIAEESTAWPLVTRPADVGGLGFTYKWNMGWMNDTLSYAKTDPLFRKGLHNNLTFSLTYAFSENYILPISHDEIVHGKGSLLNKMPGDYDCKFAGFRNYLMNMFAHPGKKLLMMGCELGMFKEWDFASELDWGLLEYPAHRGAQAFVKKLNTLYRTIKPLYEIEDDWAGFEWLVPDDGNNNVYVYERRDKEGNRLVCVYNMSPVAIENYTFGVSFGGTFTEILHSDLDGYSEKPVKHVAKAVESHGKPMSITMHIPAMSGIYMLAPPAAQSATAKGGAKKPTAKTTAAKPAAKSGTKTATVKSGQKKAAVKAEGEKPAAVKAAGAKKPAVKKTNGGKKA
ncbi:MAG: 1,4-alpha-glucan branching protein GlgB [Clostridiales bacterium]|nr:1,4-alpha-glucan branching protein GlgB [Clostridiales bacterium]